MSGNCKCLWHKPSCSCPHPLAGGPLSEIASAGQGPSVTIGESCSCNGSEDGEEEEENQKAIEALKIHSEMSTAFNAGQMDVAKKAWKKLYALMPAWLVIDGNDERKKRRSILLMGRSALEMGCKLAILDGKTAEFERRFHLLHPYFEDDVKLLPVTEASKVSILEMKGLMLMYLLAENRLAEFHLELEKLSDLIETEEMIKAPFRLERYMMMGNYNRVVHMRNEVPNAYFSFFVERLLNKTIRKEELSCIMAAYSKILFKECMNLVHMDSEKEFQVFLEDGSKDGKAVKFTEDKEGRKWIVFREEEEDDQRVTKDFSQKRQEVALNMYSYASRLNEII